MRKVTKAILSIVFIAFGARAGFPQVITGNLPATKEELSKLATYETSPTAIAEGALPLSADNSEYLVVGHQKKQGACSAFAVSYAISMLASLSKQGTVNLSPYFIWDIASLDNLFENGSPISAIDADVCSNWVKDSETSIENEKTLITNYRLKCRDCDCDLCRSVGISIPQALYESRKFGGIPLAENYERANCGKVRPNIKQTKLQKIQVKSSTLHASDRRNFGELLPEEMVAEIKSLIARKLPVVIATNVYFNESYKGEVIDVEKMGIEEGYHAMTVVGFDDNKIQDSQAIPSFKIINSWGKEWGDNGYLWVSHEAFRRMVKEVYVVSLDSPDDNRIIIPGNSIGAMRFKLGYTPYIDGKDVDICLDANTWTDEKPVDFPNEVIGYQCHDGHNQIWELINIKQPNKYLIKAYNGKFLTVIDDKVLLDVDKNSEYAQWFLEKSSDGSRYIFKLSAKSKTFVLGVDNIKIDFYNKQNPPSIELNYDNGSAFQQWTGLRVLKKERRDNN